ncbi:MAG: NADH:ubiquinone reductase (Na(+)-transporting) subunit F, partial [Bacteroidales bacterium]|nr:NADH:ubiquinone reductase (Na(+)-transporting) subunit F [Bacteroidales bacterium]
MLTTVISAICLITLVTLILVALLLWIKAKLTPSGNVKISINSGSKELSVTPGGNLMNTLAGEG